MNILHRLKLRLLAHMLWHHDKYHPTIRLNMGYWGDVPKRGAQCEFAACACGAASQWLPFNILGLNYYIRNGHALIPTYARTKNWSAIQKFFGLNGKEAMYLFCSAAGNYPDDVTPKMVASRILDFIRKGGL